jgi:hypothetical protein
MFTDGIWIYSNRFIFFVGILLCWKGMFSTVNLVKFIHLLKAWFCVLNLLWFVLLHQSFTKLTIENNPFQHFTYKNGFMATMSNRNDIHSFMCVCIPGRRLIPYYIFKCRYVYQYVYSYVVRMYVCIYILYVCKHKDIRIPQEI